MSKASDLIERAEREAGCKFDDPNNPGAMEILFGALAREMGKSKFDERDDFAVGTLIMNSDKQRNQGDDLIAALLLSGMSPDDLASLLK